MDTGREGRRREGRREGGQRERVDVIFTCEENQRGIEGGMERWREEGRVGRREVEGEKRKEGKKGREEDGRAERGIMRGK